MATASDENTAVIERFIEGCIRGDLSVIDTLVTDDFVDRGRPFPPPGLEALRAFHESLAEAISDIHVHIDELIAEGDKVVFRGVDTGAHTGTLMGIPATDRWFSMSGLDINLIRHGEIAGR